MNSVAIKPVSPSIALKDSQRSCCSNLFSKSAIGSALSLLFVFTFCCTAIAQDSVDQGRNALSKKSYPWYDTDNDEVRRIDLGSRPSSRSSNRNEIPVYTPPEKEASSWDWGNWNWNWGATGKSGAYGGDMGGLTWAILITILIIVIGVLIWAVSRMGSNPDDEEVIPRRSMEESIKQLPFELETASGDFRQLAQAAYKTGDYRKAITFLFSHVLVSLDQKGLIRLRKGKTNRQYLSELRLHRPLANYYQHVMVPFEATFFGDHEMDRAEFESCWNQLDQFQTGVETTSRVANV